MTLCMDLKICKTNVSYIEEAVVPMQKQNENLNQNEQQKLGTYMGYKFETVCTLNKPWEASSRTEIETREGNIVDNTPQYASVVRYRIGEVRLILGGEVDCVWDYKPEPPESPLSHYVELKTSKSQKSPKDRSIFERHKLLKFWAQSFLLGVPKVIVGFRSDSGLLQSIRTFETQKIPGIVRQPSGYSPWNANIAISFAEGVMKWLRMNIPKGDAVWRLQFRGGEGVEVYKLPETELCFLTKEFMEWRKSQNPLKEQRG
ncbi:Decapping nuclease rai1 [Neolecta irregularis DAH-3]|uniref:Decapping nuclease n=1 Tax=Neolecta irregularis (strain DAH-3) TaxID=1198029 RepID=A0A1U7LLG1_NEOID|nr:Decapping nuclease rai1 [Neolecta irregularis DAH-3]|eukprot:OLL23495.1 Decapping nuclease rai1 [Neolecta irregularis DAH-3]